MKCGQGKPFTITSTNAKMGSPAIQSYEKGGMVTKPTSDRRDRGIYTAEMGDPPMNPDMMTALTPAQRKAAEARMRAEPGKKKK
jgi:hypothetical protein